MPETLGNSGADAMRKNATAELGFPKLGRFVSEKKSLGLAELCAVRGETDQSRAEQRHGHAAIRHAHRLGVS